MVVAAAGVPFLKLAFLAVKQLSKPIANRAKAAARNSDAFRGIVVAVGRQIHQLQIQLTRLAEGKVSLAHITPLREQAAVDRGAEFVSEMVIYSVAASTIVYEYQQSASEKKRKEAEAAAEEERRLEANKALEQRQCEQLDMLNKRITLLDEQLWALRQEQAAHRAAERARGERAAQGWWRWFGSSSSVNEKGEG